MSCELCAAFVTMGDTVGRNSNSHEQAAGDYKSLGVHELTVRVQHSKSALGMKGQRTLVSVKKNLLI